MVKNWVHFPDIVQPIHYELKLIPNLDERKTIYWGEIEITFEVKTNTNQITLHSSGHKIVTVLLKIIGTNRNQYVSYELKPVEKWLIITTQEQLVTHTIYQLKIVFDGHFSTVPFGFFLQTFVLETKTYQV